MSSPRVAVLASGPGSLQTLNLTPERCEQSREEGARPTCPVLALPSLLRQALELPAPPFSLL